MVDLGPLHTQYWEPVTITLQALSMVEKAKLVQVRFTLYLRAHRSMWMQDGCKVYMDFYMALNGSYLIHVTWTIFKKPPLGGRPNTKPDRKTLKLQTLTTIDLLYFNMCEDPREWKLIETTFGWRHGHILWLHTTLEDPWPHYMILEVCRDGLWTISFGLSQFHGHGSWLVCVWSGTTPLELKHIPGRCFRRRPRHQG